MDALNTITEVAYYSMWLGLVTGFVIFAPFAIAICTYTVASLFMDPARGHRDQRPLSRKD
jgi:integral membrane sensor domain MASE1